MGWAYSYSASGMDLSSYPSGTVRSAGHIASLAGYESTVVGDALDCLERESGAGPLLIAKRLKSICPESGRRREQTAEAEGGECGDG
jgi:alkylated DNA nucleotide flippase Atl1